MKNIAIIPARSGSKGLKNKNIADLKGKPLMYYTIKAALESNCFDEVMVSTDSEQYADIAKKCGAKVPFLRSEKLSDDYAGSWDVVREVILNYKRREKEFNYVSLLQPTTPLRKSDDIKEAFNILCKNEANSLTSVTDVEHPVQWCFKLTNNNWLDEMAKSPYNYMRRQELEKYYHENGAIYIVDAKKILDKYYNFYEDKCIAYVMPRERSIDIDTKLDLLYAKMLM